MSKVFNEDDAHHDLFKPVKDWIINGNGRMVVGGTKYDEELAHFKRMRRLFILLRQAGKIIRLSPEDCARVDELADTLKEKEPAPDFDDPHIVALLVVSGCLIVCTYETRAIPYFKRTEWYRNAQCVPKVYGRNSKARAKQILCCRNIADICKPNVKLTKEQVGAIEASKGM
ncbi:hypothetical protein [Kordiimonas sp.]|uniref:hypothetical protein n=1 Tax=Kordiimonas sp. TaxID=1970157 RepID=UPI003A938D88